MKKCETCNNRISDQYTHCFRCHVVGNDKPNTSWFFENLRRGERWAE